METRLNAITGATGTLGSHIAELLIARGQRVRALVRPTSDKRFLYRLGAEIVEGDLGDATSVESLVSGADVVFHCAAKTDNWGPWHEYQRGNVDATRNVVQACSAHPEVRRLLHVSSIAVYGHPRRRQRPITENAQLGQHLWLWDHYNRSKIEAERRVYTLGPRMTIVRPTLFYGPRDTAFLPRLIGKLRAGSAWLIGGGENLVNAVYVADVAELAIAAARSKHAAGEVYNACTGGDTTQRELMTFLCRAAGLPPLRRRIPGWVAHGAGLSAELVGHILRRKRSPGITRHALSAFVRPVIFSNEKARQELGWRPRVRMPEGLAATLGWMETEAPELFGETPLPSHGWFTAESMRPSVLREKSAESEEPLWLRGKNSESC